MALFIKLEAICITTHLPHGSIYYTVILKAPCMCGVLKCYGPVACKLNICDRAYENRPCERKLHQVIFLLISFVLNEVFHFRNLQKNAH